MAFSMAGGSGSGVHSENFRVEIDFAHWKSAAVGSLLARIVR